MPKKPTKLSPSMLAWLKLAARDEDYWGWFKHEYGVRADQRWFDAAKTQGLIESLDAKPSISTLPPSVSGKPLARWRLTIAGRAALLAAMKG